MCRLSVQFLHYFFLFSLFVYQYKIKNKSNIDRCFPLVNDIYAAICDCQLLHPDEQEQLEDEMAGNTVHTWTLLYFKSVLLTCTLLRQLLL